MKQPPWASRAPAAIAVAVSCLAACTVTACEEGDCPPLGLPYTMISFAIHGLTAEAGDMATVDIKAVVEESAAPIQAHCDVEAVTDGNDTCWLGGQVCTLSVVSGSAKVRSVGRNGANGPECEPSENNISFVVDVDLLQQKPLFGDSPDGTIDEMPPSDFEVEIARNATVVTAVAVHVPWNKHETCEGEIYLVPDNSKADVYLSPGG